MPLEDIIIGREPANIKKYGNVGCGFLGRHVVGSGFESHVTNKILVFYGQ